jgi:RNA polymerase sigma-70 factor (ECF subfamily)
VRENLALTPAVSADALDFRGVFEAEFGYVLRTLRFLGVRDADAEDVAHDVFLAVYRHFADYDATRPLRPWLFAFAYRSARDFKALARHRQSLTDAPDLIADKNPLPDALLMHAERKELALAALDTLHDDERAVFVAHDLNELGAPEVSTTLGVPLNTVYSRLRRARSKFEAAVRRLAAKEKYR